jgi:hypothetical protein
MLKSLKRENDVGRILVLKEKHGTRYFDIDTFEKLQDVCLDILKERLDPKYGYISHPGLLEEAWGCREPYLLSDEDIAALPVALQATATQKRRDYRKYKAEWQLDLDIWNEANKAVKLQDGEAAYDILDARRDHEYEGLCFEYLENVKR